MTSSGSSGQTTPLRRLRRWLLSPSQLVVSSTVRLRVARGTQGSWIITDPDRDSPLNQFSTQEQALAAATRALEGVRGGRLQLVGENVLHELNPVPAAKRPWWQATRTPRAGLLLGLLWLGFFTLHLTTDEQPFGWNVETFLLVVSGALPALYLSSAVALLLRQRRD